jgi:hypothetical protein
MPTIIHARVVLEGRSEYDSGGKIQTNITSIRGLLDDVSRIHSAEFQSALGTLAVGEVLEDWQKYGLPGSQIPAWVEKLRKAAFEADDLGEASIDLRNQSELPDVMPGVAPVLCAMLDYLAGSCGCAGVVRLVLPDEP